MVRGDRDELIRLFENLIENGLKYGASGKRVDIALAPARAGDGKAEALVSVRDYGPGIAAEHLPRLTERFYRVDVGVRAAPRAAPGSDWRWSSTSSTGTRGVCRSTARRARALHSTFTVRLPRTDVPAA